MALFETILADKTFKWKKENNLVLIKTALVFAKTEVISGRQFQATDRTIGSTQVEHRSRVQKKSFKKRDRHFEKKKEISKGAVI